MPASVKVRLFWDRTIALIMIITTLLHYAFLSCRSFYYQSIPTDINSYTNKWPFSGFGDFSQLDATINTLSVGPLEICIEFNETDYQNIPKTSLKVPQNACYQINNDYRMVFVMLYGRFWW